VTQELPPAALARLGEARERGTWSSGLSVAEFAAISSVGFEPVGQVMGSTVHNLGWWYGARIDCGYAGGGLFRQGTASTVTSGMRGAWGGYGTYVDTLYRARRAAMGRMAAECSALGGDGVVAVSLNIQPFMGAAHHLEFQAFGTAVRARGPVRPPRPFLSHLAGQDFAKLVTGGWIPVDMALGTSIGIRHDDWRTSMTTGAFAANQEVAGWTELVSVTRHEARGHFLDDTARTGAEGVVVSVADLKVGHRECSYNAERRDHVVESTFIGTAITRFRAEGGPPPARGLTIMRLRGRE
jgi:uncharacterized protein YbjQ (UPF0145 family)